MAVGGFALLVAGFYVGYRLNISHTLAERVRMWQSPWDNAVAGGDQVAQAIWAHRDRRTVRHRPRVSATRAICRRATPISSSPRSARSSARRAPASRPSTRSIAWRGFRIGRRASNDYGFFLATALTLFWSSRCWSWRPASSGVMPLTGVVTPFLSYGGSAMAANFAALGILLGDPRGRTPAADLAPFDVPMPMRYLRGALGVAAAGAGRRAVDVQVCMRTTTSSGRISACRPTAARRYAYNPRVLDVVRQIPRGTVFDRQRPSAGDRATPARRRAASQR